MYINALLFRINRKGERERERERERGKLMNQTVDVLRDYFERGDQSKESP